MLDYRLFYLDSNGHVCEGLVLSCEDDADAIRVFDRYSLDRPMQLWYLARRIKTYAPATEA
jgi:hypothetical protein